MPTKPIATERQAVAIDGEYGTAFSFGLPGWGTLSILGALPGLAMPLLITALSDLDMPFRVILIAAAVVPMSALLGLIFGYLGIKRSKVKSLARIGAILNAAVLVACIGIVVVAMTWRLRS